MMFAKRSGAERDMGILDDASFYQRAATIISAVRGKPSETLLRRAALLEESPSPAMLEDTAEWLAIIDQLEEASFTPQQLLLLAARGTRESLGRHPPGGALLAKLFEGAAGLEVARAICEEQLVARRPTWQEEFRVHQLGNAALARLAAARAIEPRFEPVFHLHPTEPTQLRAIVASLPPDRRESFVVSRTKLPTASSVDPGEPAVFFLDKLLWLTDLVPSIRSRLEELLAAAKRQGRHAMLAAEVAAGRPRVIEKRPTAAAREALAYWLGDRVKKQRGAEIASIAAEAYARSIAVPTPELATMAAWAAASDARRAEIATLVASALRSYTKQASKVVSIAAFGAAPIAVITCGKRRFCLVPGGSFDMGFSKNEEAAVRTGGKRIRGGSPQRLLAMVDRMRPLAPITVGPLLAAQGPGEVCPPDEAADALESSRFRVPSEAEWEHLARGGRVHQLTARSNVIPSSAKIFAAQRALGAKGANPFGLWGFGFEPEVCADAWADTLDDVPRDGTPRRGAGDRVVRGGAAQRYPWQGSDEWHLLVTAFRRPHSDEDVLALRYVLGIKAILPTGFR
ncbi:MAG: hypothetical protein IPQ07_34395 [Myxococcales bacterium]|nr:hypothetical protein [Myxococcales bacterium]